MRGREDSRWSVYFECTPLPFADQPRPRLVCSQERCAPYYIENRRRTHDAFWLFKYTLEGRGLFRDRSGEHVLGAGDAFLCRTNDPQVEYGCLQGESEPWIFVYFTFRGCDGLVESLLQTAGAKYQIPRTRSMIRSLLRFEDQKESAMSLSAAEGAELVHELLWGLVALHEETEESATSTRLVRQARVLMRQHLESSYSIGKLADDLQVSLPHLSRVFRLETGAGPLAVLQQMKMEYATELLQETNLRIKEVAALTGFESASNFTRAFHRITGIVPKEVRR